MQSLRPDHDLSISEQLSLDNASSLTSHSIHYSSHKKISDQLNASRRHQSKKSWKKFLKKWKGWFGEFSIAVISLLEPCLFSALAFDSTRDFMTGRADPAVG